VCVCVCVCVCVESGAILLWASGGKIYPHICNLWCICACVYLQLKSNPPILLSWWSAPFQCPLPTHWWRVWWENVTLVTWEHPTQHPELVVTLTTLLLYASVRAAQRYYTHAHAHVYAHQNLHMYSHRHHSLVYPVTAWR